VRFDVSVSILAPDLQVIAPVREWRMTRDEEIEYARTRNIPVPVTAASPYSVDQNLWGRSVEAGALEDPWLEPPEEAFAWTISPRSAPDEPTYLEIEFERGAPVALDGERMDGVALITRLNEIAGAHGVGRIDHVENRLVGIKSREVYEAPAGVVLHHAHQDLEKLCLTRDQMRFKERVAQELGELIYNGMWFSAHHQDLAAYVASTQRHVTGTVRLRLFKGTCQAVGRRSPRSLYQFQLATYEKGDQFDHSAAVGFIRLWSQQQRTQAEVQLLGRSSDEMVALSAPEPPAAERAKQE
jgi:argininosuccinate synthase